jgi:hypothetical protein
VRARLDGYLQRRTAALVVIQPDRGAERPRGQRQWHCSAGLAGVGPTDAGQQVRGPERQRDDQTRCPRASHAQDVLQLFMARRLEYDSEWELHGDLRWRSG